MHIVFVHGLGQKEDAWGLLRDLVASNLNASHSECTYDASFLTKSSPERAAQLLATHISLETNDDPEVVLVAYSLGGLVARQMLTMVFKREIEQQELLNRVRGIVTLGTPLDGAKTRRAIHLARSLKWLGFISAQNSNQRIPFRQATRNRSDSEVPTFFHYQFERDFWVLDHDTNNYTQFDNPVGTLPGSHTDFLTDNNLGRKVSEGLTNTIRKLRAYGPTFSPESGTAAPSVSTAKGSDETTEYTEVILISCSNSKKSDEARSYQPPQPGAWLSNMRLRDQLIEKRATIFDKLKTHQVVDQKFSQGNRGDRRQNLDLFRGPDFGMYSDADAYLPAIERYSGRLYAQSRNIDWAEFHARPKRPLILIMSALYGLVQSDEHIQNYDAGISDIDLGSSTPLKGMWTDWMTEALNCTISQIGRKVRIFNLMADDDYTSSIRWSSLKRENCSVYHLASNKFNNIELLPVAGIVFGGVIRNPDILSRIERTSDHENHLMALSRFGEAPAPYAGTYVAFERTAGELSDGFNWNEAIANS